MSKENLDHLSQGAPHPASRSALTRPVATLSHQMGEGHLPSAEKGSTPEGFIGKTEVARRLNKTIRTVDNWMQRRLLPYYKIGRSVEFKWSDVEAHLAQTCRVCRS